jgi:hypothetical protein
VNRARPGAEETVGGLWRATGASRMMLTERAVGETGRLGVREGRGQALAEVSLLRVLVVVSLLQVLLVVREAAGPAVRGRVRVRAAVVRRHRILELALPGGALGWVASVPRPGRRVAREVVAGPIREAVGQGRVGHRMVERARGRIAMDEPSMERRRRRRRRP